MTDKDDPGAGKRAGDEGMKRVKRANEELMVQGLILIRALPKGWRGEINDIRGEIETRWHAPTHPNFYGSLAREAIKLELLRRTGLRVPMRRVRSHARRTDELIRT